MTSACNAAGCRVLAAVTEAYANASAANVPVLPLAGNHTIDDLKRSKANLRRRCLDLFSKLTEARARINDLERELSVMKYVVKDASKSSEEHSSTGSAIDLEQCTLCATEVASVELAYVS